MYEYMAEVTRIRDGDTIEVDLDLGLYTHIHVALRLMDVDAPEIVGKDRAEGLLAKEHLESVIPVGSIVKVQTYRRNTNLERYVQTFDRFVAYVYRTHDIRQGSIVNLMMRQWLTERMRLREPMPEKYINVYAMDPNLESAEEAP